MSKTISSQDISSDIQMSFDEYKTLPFISGIASLMLYRCLSQFESQKESNAKSKPAIFKSAIPENLQWENWNNLRGNELKVFIKTQLIPNLKNIRKTHFSHYYKQIVTVLEHQENQDLEFLELNNDTTMDWLSQYSYERMKDSEKACNALEEILYDGYQYGSTLDDARIPRLLDDLMVNLLDPKATEHIYDPCPGIGGLLTGCVEYIKKKEGLYSSKSKFDLKNFNIYGEEIDVLSYVIALTRLALSGVSFQGLILGDTLLNQSKQKSIPRKFDCILAVPPWGGRVSDAQRDQFLLKTWESEGLFLQHIMGSLRPHGRAIVAIPDRILYRGDEYKKLRQKMTASFDIEAIVSLPAFSFAPYSDLKASLICIRREKKSPSISFMNVSQISLDNWHMSDRFDAEKSNSLSHVNTIRKIAQNFRNKNYSESVWKLTVNDLKKRDYQLLPKQCADDTLEGFINNLYSIDPQISRQPLWSVADIYEGIALPSEVLSFASSESEDRNELLSLLDGARKRKSGADVYLIEAKCWDAISSKENNDELKLIKLRDFDISKHGIEKIIDKIRSMFRADFIKLDQQPLYLASSDIDFIKSVRPVTVLTYQISQQTCNLEDMISSYIIPILKISDITKKGIKKPSCYFSVEETKKDFFRLSNRQEILIQEKLMLRKNDYVLATSSIVGKGTIVENITEKMIISNQLTIIRPKSKIHPTFLAALMNSEFYQSWMENNSLRTAYEHSLNVKALRTMPILLPPPDLQKRVAKMWNKSGGDACLILIKELAASLGKKSGDAEGIIKLLNGFAKEKEKRAGEKQREYEFQMVKYLKHNLNSKIGQLKIILETIEGFLTKINLLDTPLQEPLFEGDEVGSAREFIKDGINNLKQMKGVLTSVTDLVTEEYRDEDFELIDLNGLFENDIIKPRAQNFDINIKCDAKSKLRIHKRSFVEALNQIIENAKKHGFVIPGKHYKIFFNITETVSEIIIDYINDGEPLPENITAKEFLAFGKSGVDIKGEGLGGSWIGKALKAINADFEIIRDNNPVHFRISIPKE